MTAQSGTSSPSRIKPFSLAVVILCALVLFSGNSAQARVQIASGALHTAALKQDGTVWTWGHNYYGQLGNGTTVDANVPVQVIGLTEVAAIGVGGSHTVALKQDGTVWAWGRNEDGQLGNGTSVDTSAPVQVSGLAEVTTVAAGAFHTVALKSDGTVWAWGRNGDGQLGNGTTVNTTEPVRVEGLTDAVAIDAGFYHTAALKRDGTVWTWGYNAVGQLGNGTTLDTTAPVQVSGLADVSAIATGIYHTAALKRDGTVWTWGYNADGQLGNGTTAGATVPVLVTGLTDAAAIDAGFFHTAALKRDGTVWAWGLNDDGQLGNGTTVGATAPVQASGLASVTAIAAGYWQTFARQRDSTVWAWGYNEDGQLGNGTNTGTRLPVQVSGLLLAALMADLNDDGVIDLSDAIIALQVLSGNTAAGIRDDYATSDADVNGDGLIGMPEALYALASTGSSDDANTPAKTISGPGGSSLVAPVGGLNGGAAISLTETTDTAGLVAAGVRLVSAALVLTTSSPEALFGDGTFSISIPVARSSITEADKLLLKVMLNNGSSYALLGVYDAEAGVFRVELSGVISGWKIAVVEDPSIEIIRAAGSGGQTAGSSRSPMAWLTDLDWKTFEWTVVNHTNMSEEDIRTKILPVLWDTSAKLAYAGFRSPKIYLDPRLTPTARVCHLIGADNADGSHFHAGAIVFDNGTWIYTEDQENYSTLLRNDDELAALGQMYVNYDQFVDLNAQYGVSLGNIVIHELFHAVQYGYDVRKNQKSMAAYLEGTATPLGQTYQDTAGSITGPSVSVRVLRPNEHARLYQAVDDPKSPLHYTKQDFFAYVSKRYGADSFAWTEQLFEYMSIWTANKFGLTASEYRTLYRKATDALFNDQFAKGLSRIYREYALDRAYEHGAHSVLRPAEETEANGFGPNHLAKTLFQWNANDTLGFKKFEPETTPSITFPAIEPLSCYAFSMDLPDQADPETPAPFPLLFTLQGAEILPSSDGGIKIFVFLEDADGNMVGNGRIEITDISNPVMIPFHADARSLTALIINGYLEATNASVTVSAGPYIEKISPNPAEPDARITLEGLSFGATRGTSKVYLGDDEVSDIVLWNNTRIEFTLPVEAESGKVKVVVNGSASNEVQLEVEIVEPDPHSFAFVKSWSKSHFPSGWGVAPDTIDFTATVNGRIANAINPVIEVKDFANSENSKLIRFSNMKRAEVVTVEGTMNVSLSTLTVSPTTSSIPQHRYVYTYANPRLVVYEDGVFRQELPGPNFSWVFDAQETYENDIDLYVEYDVTLEYYKRETEEDSLTLQQGYPNTAPSKVFHLYIDVIKDVPNWGTP